LKDQLARNISTYRKELGLRQEELARILGLSFQAVSKWENAQTMPDISLLPRLSQTLEVSIDKLLGYVSQDRPITIYEEQYKTPDYYWGTEPNSACYQVLQVMPPVRRLKLLDVGCGEGKDAVFFARNGYAVTAFDVSDAGIDKTKRLADIIGVQVDVLKRIFWTIVWRAASISCSPAVFCITLNRSSAMTFSTIISGSQIPAGCTY
jgi:tellurite methyltransferase